MGLLDSTGGASLLGTGAGNYGSYSGVPVSYSNTYSNPSSFTANPTTVGMNIAAAPTPFQSALTSGTGGASMLQAPLSVLPQNAAPVTIPGVGDALAYFAAPPPAAALPPPVITPGFIPPTMAPFPAPPPVPPAPAIAPPATTVGQVPSVFANDIAGSIRQIADWAGVSPQDVGGVFQLESSFNPAAVNPKGYTGLIQFSPDNMQTYGITRNSSIADQTRATISYLADNGFKPGEMTGAQFYATIQSGSPGGVNKSDTANGGLPGTVMDKYNSPDFQTGRDTATRLLANAGLSTDTTTVNPTGTVPAGSTAAIGGIGSDTGAPGTLLTSPGPTPFTNAAATVVPVLDPSGNILPAGFQQPNGSTPADRMLVTTPTDQALQAALLARAGGTPQGTLTPTDLAIPPAPIVGSELDTATHIPNAPAIIAALQADAAITGGVNAADILTRAGIIGGPMAPLISPPTNDQRIAEAFPGTTAPVDPRIAAMAALAGGGGTTAGMGLPITPFQTAANTVLPGPMPAPPPNVGVPDPRMIAAATLRAGGGFPTDPAAIFAAGQPVPGTPSEDIPGTDMSNFGAPDRATSDLLHTLLTGEPPPYTPPTDMYGQPTWEAGQGSQPGAVYTPGANFSEPTPFGAARGNLAPTPRTMPAPVFDAHMMPITNPTAQVLVQSDPNAIEAQGEIMVTDPRTGVLTGTGVPAQTLGQMATAEGSLPEQIDPRTGQVVGAVAQSNAAQASIPGVYTPTVVGRPTTPLPTGFPAATPFEAARAGAPVPAGFENQPVPASPTRGKIEVYTVPGDIKYLPPGVPPDKPGAEWDSLDFMQNIINQNPGLLHDFLSPEAMATRRQSTNVRDLRNVGVRPEFIGDNSRPPAIVPTRIDPLTGQAVSYNPAPGGTVEAGPISVAPQLQGTAEVMSNRPIVGTGVIPEAQIPGIGGTSAAYSPPATGSATVEAANLGVRPPILGQGEVQALPGQPNNVEFDPNRIMTTDQGLLSAPIVPGVPPKPVMTTKITAQQPVQTQIPVDPRLNLPQPTNWRPNEPLTKAGEEQRVKELTALEPGQPLPGTKAPDQAERTAVLNQLMASTGGAVGHESGARKTWSEAVNMGAQMIKKGKFASEVLKGQTTEQKRKALQAYLRFHQRSPHTEGRP